MRYCFLGRWTCLLVSELNNNNNNFCNMKENSFHNQSQFIYTAALKQHRLCRISLFLPIIMIIHIQKSNHHVINYYWFGLVHLVGCFMACHLLLVWFVLVLWHIIHFLLFNAKSSLYIYIMYIWFGLIAFLWHINHCRLFNTTSSLYIYIRYIWFGLVGFYSISTIIGYLMSNHLYTYISNIYDLLWLGFMGCQQL